MGIGVFEAFLTPTKYNLENTSTYIIVTMRLITLFVLWFDSTELPADSCSKLEAIE